MRGVPIIDRVLRRARRDGAHGRGTGGRRVGAGVVRRVVRGVRGQHRTRATSSYGGRLEKICFASRAEYGECFRERKVARGRLRRRGRSRDNPHWRGRVVDTLRIYDVGDRVSSVNIPVPSAMGVIGSRVAVIHELRIGGQGFTFTLRDRYYNRVAFDALELLECSRNWSVWKSKESGLGVCSWRYGGELRE